MKEFIDTKSFLRTIDRRIRRDRVLIQIAAQTRQTGKWKMHRGMGLKQTIKKIGSINGNVTIYGRKGIVQFPNPESRQGRRSSSDLKESIRAL